MYRVKVVTVRAPRDDSFGAGLAHFRVEQTADVKTIDGNLVIFGCEFDWEVKRGGNVVRTGHQVSRVTVIPAGQWKRLDITKVDPSDSSY